MSCHNKYLSGIWSVFNLSISLKPNPKAPCCLSVKSKIYFHIFCVSGTMLSQKFVSQFPGVQFLILNIYPFPFNFSIAMMVQCLFDLFANINPDKIQNFEMLIGWELTLRPLSWSFLIFATLWEGKTSAKTLLIPAWRAMAPAVFRLSPVKRMTSNPILLRVYTAKCASGFTVSAAKKIFKTTTFVIYDFHF